MNSLILTCAGKGSRAGFSYNKLLHLQGDKTILEKSFYAFYNTGLFDEFIVTVSESDYSSFKKLLPYNVILVIGGETRTASIKNALKSITGNIVLIHDGARPFVTSEIIKNVIDSTIKYGSGIPAIPSTSTLARSLKGNITEILGKDNTFIMQTPQGFKSEEIKKAYSMIDSYNYPDDSSVYLKYIKPPKLVKGSEKNIKLTYKDDFINSYVYGVGYDTHQLVENRPLILGGIKIPYNKGLLGHSDADVLTHAIMDAILSSLSLRDIGYHFNDKDEQYKDISSIVLLKKVLEMVDEQGYKIKNVTATILAEKPKLMKYIPEITENLARELGISPNYVGIGATTTEGLGFIGREEGIAVHATALLIKNNG